MTVAGGIVEQEHLDNNGFRRRGNQWGFNSFVDPNECIASVRRFARRKSHWYLWKLADGTYTHVAVLGDPSDEQGIYNGAEMVQEFDA